MLSTHDIGMDLEVHEYVWVINDCFPIKNKDYSSERFEQKAKLGISDNSIKKFVGMIPSGGQTGGKL